jgi:uncharacterized protein (TIGR03435 family)
MSMIGRMPLPILLASSCFAQSPPGPEFGVASIRPSASSPLGNVDIGMHLDGAQVRCVSFSLKDYLGIAYRMKAAQISGPDWMDSERFDIAATLPAGSTASQLPDMFQALLADRFRIKAHREKKELPVYLLGVGKDPLKLKETPPNPDADRDDPKGVVNAAGTGSAAGVGVNLGHGTSYSFANRRFEAVKLTMAQFAENLEPFANRPIIDMTGLNGRYDFAIDFTAEDFRAMMVRGAIARGVVLAPEALRALDGSSEGALGDALQQIGLKLEARKAPLDVLVIDDALKTPTAN